MKLKIVKAQKVSEIQMKSGFNGFNHDTTDTDRRPGTAHPFTRGSTWTQHGNLGWIVYLRDVSGRFSR